MEKLLRSASEGIFYINYIGLFAGGAFTFIRASEKKEWVFK